jgi:hypothetical protein
MVKLFVSSVQAGSSAPPPPPPSLEPPTDGAKPVLNWRRLGREMNGSHGIRHHSGDELDTSRIQPGLPDHRK